MSQTLVSTTQTQDQERLQELIDKAKLKLQIQDDNQLCRYVPDDGSKVHHFTLKKWRKKEPKKLEDLITTHIMNVENPVVLPVARRAAKHPRNKLSIPFSSAELKKIADLLNQAGDNETAKKALSCLDTLEECRKQLLQSIRERKLQPHLWEAYANACKARSIEPSSSDA